MNDRCCVLFCEYRQPKVLASQAKVPAARVVRTYRARKCRETGSTCAERRSDNGVGLVPAGEDFYVEAAAIYLDADAMDYFGPEDDPIPGTDSKALAPVGPESPWEAL